MIAGNPDAAANAALAALLATLRRRDYRFVTPTPATHARVIGRGRQGRSPTLTDILGWSFPWLRDDVDAELFDLLHEAGVVSQTGDGCWRSAIRVSSLHDDLFLHSAYPTDAHDAVFFGPDSYRFADAIVAELDRKALGQGARILDIGTGSGVGAIVAGRACPDAAITMTDINPMAMRYATINAAGAGIPVHGVVGYDLSGVAGQLDLILANPPYIADPAARAYRDGGGAHGSGVALAMTRMALARLAPGGRFLLYTGSAITSGEDRQFQHLSQLADQAGCKLRYREIDPDVFGEELANPAYQDVDRIAVVVAIFTRPNV
jgi:hypothetical protein